MLYKDGFATQREAMRAEMDKFAEDYLKHLTKVLADNNLEWKVARKSDGVWGFLKIKRVKSIWYPYEVAFHPITVKGTVSLKCSGYIDSLEELTTGYIPLSKGIKGVDADE